jgi:thiol-disulfide isomerase/thioredoxin
MLFRKLVPLLLCLVLAAAALLAANVPRPSREFAIDTLAGKQVLLSNHRGKVVALLFILTTCPHCQQVTQSLSKLQREYGAKGLQVLSAAIEDNAAGTVPGFIKRFQPAFPVGWTNRYSAGEYLQHPTMLRMMMPQLVFIDRTGTIRAQYAGDDPFFGANQDKNLRGMIENLLKSAPKKKG